MSLVLENNIASAEGIAGKLRREIGTLSLEAGTRLQPLRDLAVRYGTSYITMRKAINMLCDEGLLTSRRGAGVYVCANNEFSYSSQELTNKAVAMLFCGMEQHITTSPLYSKLLYGIEKEAGLQGYDVVISLLKNSDNFQKSDIYANSCGFLAIGSDVPGVEQLFKAKPFVWMMGAEKHWGDHFTYNNISIGRLAAKYALEGKFNSYAGINVDPLVGAERLENFVNCLKFEGKDVLSINDTEALVIGKFEQHTDRDSALGWMDSIRKLKPPALLFLASEITIDIVHHLIEANGLTVGKGKDIEIIACNIPKTTSKSIPNYAGIDLCAEELGRLAMNHLLWRLENPNTERVVLKLEPQINIR